MKVNSSDLETIFNRVASKHNVEPELVEEIFKHEFGHLRHSIANLDYPVIMLHGLGTFEIKLNRLENYIKSYIKSYRQGNTSYQKIKEVVTKLWQLRKRLKHLKAINKRTQNHITKKYVKSQKISQQK